jgi:hypothetical protein
MKNTSIMMGMVMFASTAIISMERPNYAADELRIAKNSAKNVLGSVDFSS